MEKERLTSVEFSLVRRFTFGSLGTQDRDSYAFNRVMMSRRG